MIPCARLWPTLVMPLLLSAATNSAYRHSAPGTGSPVAMAHKAQAMEQYGQLPLYFEPNVGQTDAHVQFLARTGGSTAFTSRVAAQAAQAARPRRRTTQDRTRATPARRPPGRRPQDRQPQDRPPRDLRPSAPRAPAPAPGRNPGERSWRAVRRSRTFRPTTTRTPRTVGWPGPSSWPANSAGGSSGSSAPAET